MAANDLIQVSLACVGTTGERMLNVLTYRQVSGGGTPLLSEANAIADAFDANLSPLVQLLLSPGATYGETNIKFLTGLGANIVGRSISNAGAPGTSSGAAGPIERTLVLRKHTGIAGRQNQGRVYIPQPCREMFKVDGTYDGTNPDSADIPAVLSGFLATITATVASVPSDFVPVVFHRATLGSTQIIAFTFSTLVGVQRRRRIGIGI